VISRSGVVKFHKLLYPYLYLYLWKDVILWSNLTFLLILGTLQALTAWRTLCSFTHSRQQGVSGCRSEGLEQLAGRLRICCVPFCLLSWNFSVECFVFRLHRMHETQTIVIDVRGVCLSVSLSVCLTDTRLNSVARAVRAGSFGAAFAKLLWPLVWFQPVAVFPVFVTCDTLILIPYSSHSKQCYCSPVITSTITCTSWRLECWPDMDSLLYISLYLRRPL